MGKFQVTVDGDTLTLRDALVLGLLVQGQIEVWSATIDST